MLRVTCAIIECNNEVLIAQRSSTMLLPLRWEFPGGKIEAGEREEDCIRREVKEEVDLDIKVLSKLTPVEHHYDTFSLILIPFLCTSEHQSILIREHAQVRWVCKDVLLDYDWAEADIPIVKEYLAR